jgi:hypothetical protein
MIIKSALVAMLASAMGFAVVGCMSAETGVENVEETAEALTTGITFDPTNFVLSHTLDGTTWTADTMYYPPGNSLVTYNVPCAATQVRFQARLTYNDTGAELWPAVTAAIPGLPTTTANIISLTQGNSRQFGQVANFAVNPLSGAASDQPLAVVLTLKSYSTSSYSGALAVPSTTMTYYLRRLCTCP